MALATEHCCQELVERAAALAELVLAAEQCCQELADHAAVLAEAKQEKALADNAKVQRCQESADRAEVSAETTHANEHQHQDAVK